MKIEHFVSVDVGLEKATLRAIDINGDIFDEFTVSKRDTIIVPHLQIEE